MDGNSNSPREHMNNSYSTFQRKDMKDRYSNSSQKDKKEKPYPTRLNEDNKGNCSYQHKLSP
jgi:hypothetical protein